MPPKKRKLPKKVLVLTEDMKSSHWDESSGCEDLNTLQKHVKGSIEMIGMGDDWECYVNDEGLLRGMPQNVACAYFLKHMLGKFNQIVYGPAVVVFESDKSRKKAEKWFDNLKKESISSDNENENDNAKEKKKKKKEKKEEKKEEEKKDEEKEDEKNPFGGWKVREEEMPRWNYLAGKFDAIVKDKNSPKLTREEVRELISIWWRENPCESLISYCMEDLNSGSDDCLYK
jgi:hypothetical protein